ncbi:MAG: hypothetical protein MI975_04670 [Cytophagales bacterium]|nr:hypothetical protein [Cytophagales bacterium]
MDKLKRLLEEVESFIDVERQKESDLIFEKSLNFEHAVRLPFIISYPYPKDVEHQPYTVEETFADPEIMLYNQLLTAWDSSIYCKQWLYDDLPLTFRANFGTIIIPTMLGGTYEIVGDNPPWVKNFDDFETFENHVADLTFDASHPLFVKVKDFYSVYKDILCKYPKTWSVSHFVLPDLQGPLSNYEQLRGSTMYTDFFERPEFVLEKLNQLATYQIDAANHLINHLELDEKGWSYQHGNMIKGNMLIRDDALALMSGDIYRDFAAAADDIVLKALNGGGIHSCGKFDHTIDEVLEVDNLTCIDLGQSHMNDMIEVYTKASAKKIPLIRVQMMSEELKAGNIRDKYPTGVTLRYEAKSLKEAREVWNKYISNQ